MKYFKEVTDWGSTTAQNHTYYLNDERSFMVGYIKSGTTELFKFKKPIRIDTRGRQFELLKIKGEPDSVYFGVKEEPKKNVITVKGSGGKEYFIEKVGTRFTCTCPGFSFRGKCKHIESII